MGTTTEIIEAIDHLDKWAKEERPWSGLAWAMHGTWVSQSNVKEGKEKKNGEGEEEIWEEGVPNWEMMAVLLKEGPAFPQSTGSEQFHCTRYLKDLIGGMRWLRRNRYSMKTTRILKVSSSNPPFSNPCIKKYYRSSWTTTLFLWKPIHTSSSKNARLTSLPSLQLQSSSFIKKDPKGTVLVLGAWNYRECLPGLGWIIQNALSRSSLW